MEHVVVPPQITIVAAGVPIPEESVRALGEVWVQQRLSLPTLCELAFYDPPGPLDVASDLTPGTPLRVEADGYQEPLFTGEVTAVEHVYGPAGEREIRVRGYDLLHRLRKRQSVRAHVQVTPRDLAQELATELGLTVQATEPGPLWPRIIQHYPSDFDMLVDLAQQHGLYLTLREGVLHLLTLAGIGVPVPLTLGESLLEVRIDVNGEASSRSVTTSGWNALRVETFVSETSNVSVGRDVLAEVPPERVGGSGRRDLLDEAVHDARQAEAMAQAELDRRVAHEVTLWGIAEGDPCLRPGTPIDVLGVDDAIAGRYVLTSVNHTLDGRKGFTSELSTLPPPPRGRARGAVAALGEVTGVADPENLGRVRVSLPTYGDVETEWMQVLSAGAGEDKGLIVMPNVGDQVLVLFSHEDPGQGVVLGGLYGMRGAPDSGVEGNAVRRYSLQTPGGHRIQFDDAGQLIRLEDSTGSYLEMSSDKVHLHAAVDLEVEAPGGSVVIRGQAIDFQRG